MQLDPLADDDTPRSADDAIPTPASDFPVVGIGASAGGIAALQRFFHQMPADSGMAFVVILHLSPEHVSHLAEVLQQSTAMPVQQVSEAVSLAPDRVYVIPPARQLTLVESTLQLSEPAEPRDQRAPIDLFFRSLAETQGQRAAAVVLSGTGADGASGVKRVKERGGLVLVQDPAEAEYDTMPRHAIATGLVDVVLPTAELPVALVAYWQQAGAPALSAATPLTSDGDETALRELLATLRIRTGHDFSQYKRPTLFRRIARRMQVTGATTLPAYLALLRARPEEGPALLRDLLISVTNFFRDPPAWEALMVAIPLLFQGKGAGDTVRAWVAGCATGEEAYSVAMLLAEYAATLEQRPRIQVFATDIDEHAIAVARSGIYPNTIAVDVSPERLQRFFTSEPGHYRVRKELRDLVLFAPHNLLRDPPFSKLDLITCRNLLIYIDRTMQEQILRLFHFTLLPEHLLLLGSSESTDGVANLFTPLDKAQRLFQRRSVPSTVQLVPELPLASPQRPPGTRGTAPGALFQPSFDELAAQGLSQYGPPGVIVNADNEIVHLARGAGRFLQPPDGVPSSSLLKTLHPELRLELRSALYQARQEGQRTETRRVRLRLGSSVRQVIASVQPLAEPAWAQGYGLIFFYDLPDNSDGALGTHSDAEPLVRQLEEELQHVRNQLRTTSEQYEAALEEHKAGHEELQAINEELRVASEELETSKEELQATNEELLAVNDELKHRVEELSRTTSDLQNLMASTAIGTIFVDRELRIKRYTPSAQAIINLLPSDVNRPLSHITHTLADDQLIADTRRVLATLIPAEREVASQDGVWYLLRIQPYRTETDQIDGVVLTFVDITQRRAAEQAMRSSEERLRLLIESVEDYAIVTYTPDNQVASWNVGAERIFGYAEAEIVGQDGTLLFTPEDRAAGVPAQELEKAVENGRAEDERWHMRKDGNRFYASGVMRPMRDEGLHGFVKVLRDLTERKRTEEALRESEVRFRTVTDVVPQVIWANDADGRATYFNQRWFEYSGLSEEQSVGRGWQAIVHADDAPASVEQWRQVLAAGAPFETEYRLRRADGAYRWHLGRNVPLHDASGQVTSWFGSATDIEELKQAEAARRESAVLRRLAKAQEEERLRIARDLHDQLGQQITGLLLGLKQVEQAAAGTPIAAMLTPLQELADELAREAHQLAINLRPTALEDIGLVPALERLVADWSAETGIPAAFERIGLGQGRLPRQVEVALFRVAQEALTNVRKHAEASRVGVIIERRGEEAVLVVEDNGRGLELGEPVPDGEHPPLGLLGMRERVGQVGGMLGLESSPGGGTTVLVRIPLDPPADSQ